MATIYSVLREHGNNETASVTYEFQDTVEATNAEQARRKAAEKMDSAELEGEGVTLIAVPARNWRTGRGTLKAETTRRIRST